jgi:hypothetical protein
LDLDFIREAVKQLSSRDVKIPEGRDCEPRMTVGGVVMMGSFGFMHPETAREIMGEEAYQEMLAKPRIVTEYDVEEI